MRLTIAAIGKNRPGPELDLFQEYTRRLPWKIQLKELEVKRDLPAPKRKEEEGALLLQAASTSERRVVLDERGKLLTSREFSDQLKRWQDEGVGEVAFIIGGADGTSEPVQKSAQLLLSFGRMSWPHMLARAMLAEQLYRASSLMAGHPYHRD